MKKQVIFFLLLLVAFGCNRSNSNDVLTEPYVFTDSVLVQNEFEEDYSYYSMQADLPITKNDSLRLNIMNWMFDSRGDDYKAYVKADKERFFAEEGNEPRAAFDSEYSLSEQTQQYVTYISEGYMYTGGAHPLPWYSGTTFSKIDGSIVGYDMFNHPEDLIDLISENIRTQYFEPFNTEEEEYLFDPDEPFQLPTNLPWIETDSVVFCYGPYEIAPYAAGMPLCKISKNALLPYLSEKGKSLFNFE